MLQQDRAILLTSNLRDRLGNIEYGTAEHLLSLNEWTIANLSIKPASRLVQEIPQLKDLLLVSHLAFDRSTGYTDLEDLPISGWDKHAEAAFANISQRMAREGMVPTNRDSLRGRMFPVMFNTHGADYHELHNEIAAESVVSLACKAGLPIVVTIPCEVSDKGASIIINRAGRDLCYQEYLQALLLDKANVYAIPTAKRNGNVLGAESADLLERDFLTDTCIQKACGRVFEAARQRLLLAGGYPEVCLAHTAAYFIGQDHRRASVFEFSGQYLSLEAFSYKSEAKLDAALVQDTLLLYLSLDAHPIHSNEADQIRAKILRNFMLSANKITAAQKLNQAICVPLKITNPDGGVMQICTRHNELSLPA